MLFGVGHACVNAEVFDPWLSLATVEAIAKVIEVECRDEGDGGEKDKYDADRKTHGGYDAGNVGKTDKNTENE